MADETGASLIPTPEPNNALIEATKRSFDIIVQLSAAKFDHEDVQVKFILHKIHKGAENYIASIFKSFKTAESGYAFAKMTQGLCIALSSGRTMCSDEFIYDSIARMREIAQKAHADAKITAGMFNANSREFTEIRFEVAKTSKSIEADRMQARGGKEKAESKSTLSQDVPVLGSIVAKDFNSKAKSHETKVMVYEQALQYLEPATKDLARLMVEMNTVTEYWNGVHTDLKYINDQAKKLRDDHRLQLKIKSLMRNWEGVEKDHKIYITALNTLLNNNPHYRLLIGEKGSSSLQVVKTTTYLPTIAIAITAGKARIFKKSR